ncbi:MAG: winged helix-turn-helix domain-containing protein [Actinobacteria bacterium]|nr:winged helix-turn-helix domain-containing protein [Actinomycetota bacterium]
MADVDEQLTFKMLGPLEVRRAGKALALGGARQRSLLALLLLHRNEVVPRERLIDALWGERPPATAVNALQVAVHGLRKLLGRDRLLSHHGGYELVVELGELDLDELERAADRARSGAASATELRQALSLWRGAAATDAYPDGVHGELARLDELRVFLLEERIEADLAVGRHAALVEELETLLVEHPYRERLRGQLMVALYRAGRQAEALESYARARRTLVDDLGIEPGPELRELEARVLRQDLDLDPPVAVPALKGVGLPVPPTPLVGRRLELGAIAGLMRLAEVRLLTLTGVGGSGKTRVALAVADELAGEYADGAHFVDLAPLARPELVIGATARALGVSEIGGQTVLDTLIEALRDREALLVTDNFEHVSAAAPAVAELLAAAPGLNVLATSRAPLRLAAEREYPILPLELPSQARTSDLAALVQNEAVALFTARAQAVRPGFEVTSENAAAVVAICAAVDGLPLALELAAARMKLLSPEGLLERLRGRLDTLTARARDVPERQRTIRATIDWSYDLIGSEERGLFAQLSVFAGGFSIEAAEAICAVDGRTLELLVDSSLVQPAEDGRLRMLETVRQRAAERLAEGEEANAVGRRHAEFFLELAEVLRPSLRGAGAETSLALVERDHDNFRAALVFARENGLVELQLRLARAIHRLWYTRGYLTEGRGWLEEALNADGPQPPRFRAPALTAAAAIAWRQGDLEAAEVYAAEGLEMFRDLGDEQELVGPLSILGVVAMSRDDYERALPLAEEMGLLARRVGDAYGLGMSLNNQAYIAWMAADVDRAETLWEECLSVAREAGTSEVRALAVSGLGDVALARGALERAGQRFRDALAIYQELAAPELLADTCICLSAVAKAEGELERAARLLGAAASLRHASGAAEQPEGSVLTYRDEVTAAGRAELGEEAFASAFAHGRANPDDVLDEELAHAPAG